MRKRRVGVTARSRQIVGYQATGTPQIDLEIAAPLELRTPTGTRGKDHDQSADGSVAKWRKSQSAENSSKEMVEDRGEDREVRCGQRARRAHEALPQTPPRGKPPETRAPFPSTSSLRKGGNPSRVRKPRPKRAPLTASLPSPETSLIRGKGGQRKSALHRASRWSAWARSNIAAGHFRDSC
jgi:hypothetical protein